MDAASRTRASPLVGENSEHEEVVMRSELLNTGGQEIGGIDGPEYLCNVE